MAYGVRQYGVRQYGDGNRVITDAGAPPPPTDDIAGTDTLTFSGSGTLNVGVAVSGTDTLTFSGTGDGSSLGTFLLDTAPASSVPGNRLVFTGYAMLTVEAAVVAPPSGTVYVKRVSPTMPAPVLDSRGRPT